MNRQKCVLSVNINKLATIRNSRGGNTPDILQCATDLIHYGAEGITIHPRPDERHIRKTDVFALHKLLLKINKTRSSKNKIEFNIEGYPSADFLKLINKIRPDQVTLVPDPPHVLTSNAGWAIAKKESQLKKNITYLNKSGARVSLFIDVFSFSEKDFAALLRLQPERVELYTEKFAKDYVTKKRASCTRQYAQVAKKINTAGIEINAGHDLDLKNTRFLLKSVPEIIECSIGHALISESLYLGFKKTIHSYRREMKFSSGRREAKFSKKTSQRSK